MARAHDREAQEARWHASERRLNEMAAMTRLGREMHTAESERLEATDQDAIEFELGANSRPGSRKWSGSR
jgi:FPC/CPF motif-containing protein YcgG